MQQLNSWLLSSFGVFFVLGTLAIVPLPSLGFTIPKLTLLSLAAVLGAVTILFHPHRGALSALVTLWSGRWMLLFIAIILLSLSYSVAPLLSSFGSPPRYEGILAFVTYAGLAAVGVVFVRQHETRSVLLRCITTGNVLVVIYAFTQLLDLDPLAVFWHHDLFLGRVFSFLGQPTFLGQYILLTIPFLLIPRSTSARGWWMFIIFLNLCVLIATVSRAALLGGITMCVAACFLHRRNVLRMLRTQIRWILPLAFLLTILGINVFSGRFAVPTQHFALGARRAIWQGSAEMIVQRPMGYGLETMGMLSDRFIGKELKEFESLTTKIDRAHSKPLDLLITLGPLGLIAYYGLLLSLLPALLRRRAEDPLCTPLFLSILGFSVSLLFGFESIATHATFWLIVGMACGTLLKHTEHHRFRDRLPPLALIVLTGVSFLVAAQWTSARISPHLPFPFDRQMLIERAESALLVFPDTTDEEVIETLTALDQLTNGHDGMVPLLQGWHAALKGERDAAIAFLEKAQAMRPHDVVTFRIAAESYALLGDEEKVAQTYHGLIELLPPWWNNPETERGRILWKEHPWLTMVVPYAE